MLRQIHKHESILIKDDPVRPKFSYEWRTSHGRQVWVWENDSTGTIDGVICVAYTNQIPSSEDELDQLSSAIGTIKNTAVFYTIWSYAAGAGRTLLNEVAAHLRDTNELLERWVTLSPLTDMAERFHIKNGAVLLQKHKDCQNFDYTHVVKRYIEIT